MQQLRDEVLSMAADDFLQVHLLCCADSFAHAALRLAQL